MELGQLIGADATKSEHNQKRIVPVQQCGFNQLFKKPGFFTAIFPKGEVLVSWAVEGFQGQCQISFGLHVVITPSYL
jgi:hypothetical protein